MRARWNSEDIAKQFVKDLHERGFTDRDIDVITFIAMENGWVEDEHGEKVEGWVEELEGNDGEYLTEKEEDED